ncbi:MAG: Trk system potassium transporter TrkA [Lachnospiraceae bacterium]|nr:Trk system potassium transporter TrkA [Lachnospiraceae bacterium]
MKIIIVGCGNVGSTIARQLSLEGHNITLVDVSEAAVRNITEGYDVMGMIGSGTSLSVLKEAGITDADLVISVTDSDERNLLCCLLAKKAGAKHTIARVRNPEYKEDVNLLRNDLGLSMFVNPEFDAAAEIARLLRFPTAIEIDTFARGRVELLKFLVTEDSPLCGLALKDIPAKIETKILICAVERDSEVLIPRGDFELWEGDKVSFVATTKEATRFFKKVGINQGKARTCMIVGGGDTALYLAQKLIASGVEVKIIDRSKARCDELAEMLPEAVIIRGDGQDKGLLSEEGIDRTESFVTLTNFDESNVMMSIYAKKINPKAKLVTKVHRSTYDDIIDDMNIGSIINPKLLASEHVVKYVRSMQNTVGSNIESLYKLNGGRIEALEFKVKDVEGLIDTPLMNLKIKNNALICCIVHNGAIEIPGGGSVIKSGDMVIVVTTESGLSDISDILD